ncbi:hypothetical protein HBI56_083530 [Parastagonospora nodorum]|nr:hypothetical protein HBH98_098690 [Parastagonospora nodorum]KAH4382159.1 hypothetical protein HBH97_081800 [Parastagonospora nodorum]KAH4398207.1 hypothetical protein HBH99_111620 [Parastagonospora nodorum]KAH4897532.1 hypothetical protein HBI80_191480 [Parastagonospora nodorum]KAH5599408.1 hypothetical protein HBI26_088670 [Parastagonospora nodorum]
MAFLSFYFLPREERWVVACRYRRSLGGCFHCVLGISYAGWHALWCSRGTAYGLRRVLFLLWWR